MNGLFLGGGLNIVHPSEHTIFISYSSNVTVNGINVSTYGIHNADGIDLATTDTAYIFNSTFDTGDDCINFNAGTSAPGVTENSPINNFRVFNVLTNRGHGGVVFGSFTAGWIKNVLVEDSTFNGTDIGLRFKTGSDRGGGSHAGHRARHDHDQHRHRRDPVRQQLPGGQRLRRRQRSPACSRTSTSATSPSRPPRATASGSTACRTASTAHINMTNITVTKTKGASIDQFNTGVFTKADLHQQLAEHGLDGLEQHAVSAA